MKRKTLISFIGKNHHFYAIFVYAYEYQLRTAQSQWVYDTPIWGIFLGWRSNGLELQSTIQNLKFCYVQNALVFGVLNERNNMCPE